ncbi:MULTISPECIES: hypothetical protein [Rhodococcus]|uniref:hypothetical protein n=1 Tax=Rhodococcus TaxID=1827 RepID=UPI000A60FFC5|nr:MULTISPECIES: hypothetical protein [Rhodococcus]MDJ0432069.1 hypothetical protein [Rhodococcus qingshengii]
MSIRRCSLASGRALRAARFGVATFRRGRKAIDRRPSGLVWIERALAAPAGSV